MKMVSALVAILFFAGCATNAPASREQEVEQITETGPYSYQRAMGGPVVPMR